MKKIYLIAFIIFGSFCLPELTAAEPPAWVRTRPYTVHNMSAAVEKDTIFLRNKPGYMVVGDRLMKIPLKPRHIDWRPERQDVRRFTFAVSPLYVLDNGIRLDHERELPGNRSWVQYHLMVCGRGWYGGKGYVPYYLGDEGWSSKISSYETYSKMFGIGAGIAYKRMTSPLGWYYSVGGEFNFYQVWFYEDFYPGGSREIVLMNNRYYKFAANVNFGKHFALTDHLFLDFYAGLGLMGYVDSPHPRYRELNYDKFWGMAAFEYSGLYVNGGIRVGWLWNRPK